jgi:hypothetical protein
VPFRGRPRLRTRRHRLPHDERRPLVARYRAPPALSRLPLWPPLRSPFSFRLRRERRYQSGCKKETYEPVLLRSKRDAAGERVWPAYQARFRILAFRISKIDGRPRRDLQATPSRSPFGVKRRVKNMCRHSTRYDFLSPESHIMRSKFR